MGGEVSATPFRQRSSYTTLCTAQFRIRHRRRNVDSRTESEPRLRYASPHSYHPEHFASLSYGSVDSPLKGQESKARSSPCCSCGPPDLVRDRGAPALITLTEQGRASWPSHWRDPLVEALGPPDTVCQRGLRGAKLLHHSADRRRWRGNLSRSFLATDLHAKCQVDCALESLRPLSSWRI